MGEGVREHARICASEDFADWDVLQLKQLTRGRAEYLAAQRPDRLLFLRPCRADKYYAHGGKPLWREKFGFGVALR